MNKRILSGLLILVSVATSCKKDYAYLQRSSGETFKSPPKAVAIEPIQPEQLTASAEDDLLITDFNQLPELNAQQVPEAMPSATSKAVSFPKPTAAPTPSATTVVLPSSEVPASVTSQYTVQDEQQRRPLIGNRGSRAIPIGLLFLGFAVVLSLLNLTTLGLLFGLVAILFLYFGFKRLLRRRRRRDRWRDIFK